MTLALENRKRTSVTKLFGTTVIREAKAFAQYLLKTEISDKMHDTKMNTSHGHMFQINISSSKLLQQLFDSIHNETIELYREQ